MIRRSLILDTTVRLVFDGALVLSIYLLFAGHNQPGGGFVGGLVAAAAIALRYIAGGIDDVVGMLRVRPWGFLSAGLALAAGTALVPLAFGDAPLDQRAVDWHLEILGKVKFTTATVFDTGVYLIVVGLVLMVFEALGDDPDVAQDTSPGQGS
ncbi:MAG: MnhB domain-containing protein [Acidimicrobiales bacterium]|nr:MnhB domain-containing protein [Acidimicrobiales bacterium]